MSAETAPAEIELQLFSPRRIMLLALNSTVIEVALSSGCEPISLLTDERPTNGAVSGVIEKYPNIPVYTA